jgi:hypothetical protein
MNVMKFWTRVKFIDAFLCCALYVLFMVSVDGIANAITPIWSFFEEVLFVGVLGTMTLIFVGIAYLCFYKNRNELKAQSKAFRARMKFCYACGFELGEARGDRLCPKCKAKLSFRELLDEELDVERAG